MPEKRIVYVLQSESNPKRFYTGLTSDLECLIVPIRTGYGRFCVYDLDCKQFWTSLQHFAKDPHTRTHLLVLL